MDLEMIAHVDMDCFFVSVSRLQDPALAGKPVVVGGDPREGRSVVTSASYEARQFGIHAAMPMAVAIRRCPDLVVVSGDFDLYDQYHIKVKEVLMSFSPLVEMMSIDEGYVDISGTERLWGSPLEIGERMRWRIKQETGLDCSIGIGVNKLIAKVASDWAKPSGFLYIYPGQERGFLSPLPIEAIPGVGDKTAAKLRQFGLQTVGQIASLEESLVEEAFGQNGRYLWHAARGEDERSLELIWERKSISKETTFRTDTTDRYYIVAVLHYLTEKVCRGLRKEKRNARTIHVKWRYEDFETHIRSVTLQYPEDRDDIIFGAAKTLISKAITRRVGIRLIGIALSNLTTAYHQMDLFEEAIWARSRRRLSAVDNVRKKFGFDTILAGETILLLHDSGMVAAEQIS